MKSFEGYLKKKLGEGYVHLANGGHKPLSDFSMSGHGHSISSISWAGGVNLTPTASANGLEWSIDLTPGTYTGTYWHVWRASSSGISTSGTLLKVDSDTGKVSAPYGFVGNLSGNATSADNSAKLDNHTWSDIFEKTGYRSKLILANNESGLNLTAAFWVKVANLTLRSGTKLKLDILATNGSDAPLTTTLYIIASYGKTAASADYLGWMITLEQTLMYGASGNFSKAVIDSNNGLWLYYNSVWPGLKLVMHLFLYSNYDDKLLTASEAKSTLTTTEPTAVDSYASLTLKSIPTVIYSSRGIIDVKALYESGTGLSSKYVLKTNVTGGGSTWGSSITVDGKTLTIPSKPSYTLDNVTDGSTRKLSDYQTKLPLKGSATKPIYVSSAGTITECNSYPTDVDTVDGIHASGFLRWKGMLNIGSGAPFSAVVNIMKDKTKVNDGGLAMYSYSGDEYTVLIGSRNDDTRHGSALKWGYPNRYLWMIRMTSGNTTSSDWEKIYAGYADSAGNADTTDGLHVHTDRNNEANKIVRTDGNGYIQCGYINSSSGNEGNNSSPSRVWGTNGSDNYLRTYLTSALNVNTAAKLYNSTIIDTSDKLDAFHEAYCLKAGIWSGFNTSVLSSNGLVIDIGYSSASYGAQILIDDDPTYVMALRQKSSTWSAWKRIPMGDGTGASGTWGISISGNAATATSATTATNATNLMPENTAHYFRDSSNASWRGGMFWGSAGTEAMSFIAVNGSTRFQFVVGSDIASWNSSTWQSASCALLILAGGTYAPNFYTTSDIRRKENIKSISNLLPIYEFNWKSDGSKSYGFIAQWLEETNPELVSGEDYKHVNYNATLALYLAKLSNVVEDDKAKIARLEARVKELERRIV